MTETTVTQDRQFLEEYKERILPADLLNMAADFIADHCNPEDIFDTEKLEAWAVNNNEPDDIFADYELDNWAVTHGYTKEA